MSASQETRKVTSVKFTTTREKFLQFSKEMKSALALLEATQKKA